MHSTSPLKLNPEVLLKRLSEIREGNIFAIYPLLLTQIFQKDEQTPIDPGLLENLVLPSCKEWRLQKYFMLVSLQKYKDEKILQVEDHDYDNKDERWTELLQKQKRKDSTPLAVLVKQTPGPEWDLREVVKASRILNKPPLPVTFKHEQEMRRIYCLIYEVFRYKTILAEILDNVGFFVSYPQFAKQKHVTWMFVMELARRRWSARAKAANDLASKLLNSPEGSPFKQLERAVWMERIHLAAAVSRIRIKNKALVLSDLLPPHLREDRVGPSLDRTNITGWVNMFKAKSIGSVIKTLQQLGYTYSNSRQLCDLEYRFDRVCSRFITLRPPKDIGIAHCDLVNNGIVVLQEREFCEGITVFCKALRAGSLQGDIVQSHATSPRSTAYLVMQLRELASATARNPDSPVTPVLGRLCVFGAGTKEKAEKYVNELKDLGINANSDVNSNCSVCILEEPVYSDQASVATAFEGVVAALATPPNSFSAVSDPIDLICGRGGDLNMLQTLTESEMDETSQERVKNMLEEQKRTLKALMLKPQIQLILYETHSSLPTENELMVKKTIDEANRVAREKHSIAKKRKPQHFDVKPMDVIIESMKLDVQNNDKRVPQAGEHETESCIAKKNDEDASMDTEPSSKTPSRTPSRCSSSGIKRSYTKSTSVANQRNEVKKPETSSRPIPEFCTGINDQTLESQIYVPETDLFEVKRLPPLGNGLDINYILERDGCYLSLIQRKEITRLDAKYMITLAEERGLFGTDFESQKNEKRPETKLHSPRRRGRTRNFEVDRLTIPTLSFSNKVNNKRQNSTEESLDTTVDLCSVECPKFKLRHKSASARLAQNCSCNVRHKARRRTICVSEVQRHREKRDKEPPPCRDPYPMPIHYLEFQMFKNTIYGY